jgi:DNA-directed RNA polymerase sigma subunit (sigma70/sigma32)
MAAILRYLPEDMHFAVHWRVRMEEAMDLAGLAHLLKKLSTRQEKVTRLYCGLGCERTHSIQEMAQEFGVSEEAVDNLLKAARKRLEREG